jgi:hypothetical protein
VEEVVQDVAGPLCFQVGPHVRSSGWHVFGCTAYVYFFASGRGACMVTGRGAAHSSPAGTVGGASCACVSQRDSIGLHNKGVRKGGVALLYLFCMLPYQYRCFLHSHRHWRQPGKGATGVGEVDAGGCWPSVLAAECFSSMTECFSIIGSLTRPLPDGAGA